METYGEHNINITSRSNENVLHFLLLLLKHRTFVVIHDEYIYYYNVYNDILFFIVFFVYTWLEK